MNPNNNKTNNTPKTPATYLGLFTFKNKSFYPGLTLEGRIVFVKMFSNSSLLSFSFELSFSF